MLLCRTESGPHGPLQVHPVAAAGEAAFLVTAEEWSIVWVYHLFVHAWLVVPEMKWGENEKKKEVGEWRQQQVVG